MERHDQKSPQIPTSPTPIPPRRNQQPRETMQFLLLRLISTAIGIFYFLSITSAHPHPHPLHLPTQRADAFPPPSNSNFHTLHSHNIDVDVVAPTRNPTDALELNARSLPDLESAAASVADEPWPRFRATAARDENGMCEDGEGNDRTEDASEFVALRWGRMV